MLLQIIIMDTDRVSSPKHIEIKGRSMIFQNHENICRTVVLDSNSYTRTERYATLTEDQVNVFRSSLSLTIHENTSNRLIPVQYVEACGDCIITQHLMGFARRQEIMESLGSILPGHVSSTSFDMVK